MPSENPTTLVALAAILLWPFVSFGIFAICKTPSRALIWSVLVAQLLLPVGAFLKFQMVPEIDKVSISNFSAMFGCLIFFRSQPAPRWRRFGLVEFLLLANMACPIITSELNGDNIVIGDRLLPGVGLYDALSAAETMVITLIPFLLGRRCLRMAEDCRNILVILAISGLVYSAPLLFEVRFSPQLHYWVYGYQPSEFVQAIREGGFRPMVFMGHGLLAAFFLMTSVLAATALWRCRIRVGTVSSSIAAPYLAVVLVICKSMGALIYAMGGCLMIFLTRPKTQFRVAMVVVAIALTYPLLRSGGLVPTETILAIAKSVNAERAQSLEYRFDNEDQLLRRAFERPLFGWGRYGRSRVFDPESGRDISVTDGRWVIDLGQFGLVGFLAEFGLLATCVYRAASAFERTQNVREQLLLAALALILAINIFDLLPNSGLLPWTWLLSGALLGQAETLLLTRRSAKSRKAAPHLVLNPAPHPQPSASMSAMARDRRSIR
jgi:hypothetical protein